MTVASHMVIHDILCNYTAIVFPDNLIASGQSGTIIKWCHNL